MAAELILEMRIIGCGVLLALNSACFEIYIPIAKLNTVLFYMHKQIVRTSYFLSSHYYKGENATLVYDVIFNAVCLIRR